VSERIKRVEGESEARILFETFDAQRGDAPVHTSYMIKEK
jgi:hypothetical protein